MWWLLHSALIIFGEMVNPCSCSVKIRSSWLYYFNAPYFQGCVPLGESGSGFLICGVPFKQIHFQISDPSNPLWTSLKIAHFLEFPESSSKTPFFHVPWSEWSWITNPNPDPPDGTHPKTSFISCTVISVILDHKSKSGSSQRNAPQYSYSPILSEASGTWRI